MSFVEYLPIEVTHDIFLLCMDDLDHQSITVENRALRPGNHPFTFTGVCKTWAEAALSCPLLWSTISIIYRRQAEGQQPLPDHCPPLPIIAQWIDRSGDLPLSISLKPRYYPYHGMHRVAFLRSAGEVLELLAHCHHRWRRVIFQSLHPCVYTQSNPFLLSLTKVKSFPLLEEVTVREPLVRSVGSVDEDQGMPHLVDSFSPGVVHLIATSPRLKAMTIEKPYGHSTRLAILDNSAIPWKQLKNISFSFTTTFHGLPTIMNIPRLLELLETCQQLEDLKIDVELEGDPPIQAARTRRPHVTHHILKSLNLEHYSTRLFEHITLSGLKILSLSSHRGDPSEDEDSQHAAQAFAAFMERSRCRLTKFQYYDGPGVSTSIHPALDMLWAVSSTVEELDISMRPEIPKRVLCALTTPQYALLEDSDDASQITFPNLRALKLTSSLGGSTGKSRWIAGYLLNMVESRWDPPVGIARIQQVDVRFEVLGPSTYANSEEEIIRWRVYGPPFIREDIRQLRELVKRGRVGNDGRARVRLTWAGREDAEYEYVESYLQKERNVRF